MENSNLHVWDHASTTDPAFTVKNDSNGYDSISIKGYWPIKKATELWGPIGVNWGYDILEERYDEGQTIYDSASLKKGVLLALDKSKNHTLKIQLWYPDCKEGKGPIQYGHTKYMYGSRYGVTTDSEAPKKSLMDALKKCLSMLGFCSDIYMGMYEDNEYLNNVRTEFEIANSDQKDSIVDEKRKELMDSVKKVLSSIESAKSPTEVLGMKKSALRSLDKQKRIPDLIDVAKRGMSAIDHASTKKIESFKPETKES